MSSAQAELLQLLLFNFRNYVWFIQCLLQSRVSKKSRMRTKMHTKLSNRKSTDNRGLSVVAKITWSRPGPNAFVIDLPSQTIKREIPKRTKRTHRLFNRHNLQTCPSPLLCAHKTLWLFHDGRTMPKQKPQFNFDSAKLNWFEILIKKVEFSRYQAQACKSRAKSPVTVPLVSIFRL